MSMSVIDVWNQALSASHAKGRLSSLTEKSREREECERWYPLVLKTVQEAAYWPGSEVYAALALLKERDFSEAWTSVDPAPQYTFKYALPDNYLRAWHLTNYARFEIHHDVSNDRNVLSTNSEDAVLVYARLQENPVRWTSTQHMAMVYGLAAHIAGPLTGKRSIIEKNITLANNILIDAQAASANAPEPHVEAIPPQIQARGYGGYAEAARYYYPLGQLFSAAIINA